MEEDNKVNEPSMPTYNNKRFQIFSSFEEEENSKFAYAASLTPAECLLDLRKLINASYGVNIKFPEKHVIKIVYHK